jgi:hypothetical protein
MTTTGDKNHGSAASVWSSPWRAASVSGVFDLGLRIRMNGKHQIVRTIRKYAEITRENAGLSVPTRIIDGRRWPW